jgi:hypothetical protein
MRCSLYFKQFQLELSLQHVNTWKNMQGVTLSHFFYSSPFKLGAETDPIEGAGPAWLGVPRPKSPPLEVSLHLRCN